MGYRYKVMIFMGSSLLGCCMYVCLLRITLSDNLILKVIPHDLSFLHRLLQKEVSWEWHYEADPSQLAVYSFIYLTSGIQWWRKNRSLAVFLHRLMTFSVGEDCHGEKLNWCKSKVPLEIKWMMFWVIDSSSVQSSM